jgi:tetrahydromethanopterin S-methyltransferase subunit F
MEQMVLHRKGFSSGAGLNSDSNLGFIAGFVYSERKVVVLPMNSGEESGLVVNLNSF